MQARELSQSRLAPASHRSNVTNQVSEYNCKCEICCGARFLRKRVSAIGLFLLSTVLCSCVPQANSAKPPTDFVKQLESEARSFRTNHDGDRREEGSMLFGHIDIGFTSKQVREILGDPTPVISSDDRWVYELGGEDTFIFEFSNAILVSCHWLSAPEKLVLPVPGPIEATKTQNPNPSDSSQAPPAESPLLE